MTEEELAEEYANKEVPIDTFGYRSLDDVHYDVKRAFLAGLEAGKGMAETDLATIAYMQGAERYKTKWHDLQKNPKDLPDACLNIVNQDGEKVRYDYVNEVWRIDDVNDYICDVPIAWCEIPTFNDKR